MRRIAGRIRRIEPRQVALFLAVAVLVAAAACFGGREAGVGGSTAASGEGGTPEPLTLTLTAASQICETTPAKGYVRGVSYQDSEGNWVIERHSTGWDNVSETPVVWAVSGGAPPYALVIDGETRDAEQTYAGASGTASVSCALEFGETFIHDNEQRRNYRTQPEVDSGLKTIRAVATDSAGAMADASVNVYVILELGSSGDVLQSGKTYRVMGTLLTVPEGVDHLIIGGISEGEGGPTVLGLGIAVGIVGGGWVAVRHGDLREVARSTRSASAGDGDTAVGAGERELDAQIDQVMDSVGRLPTVGGGSP